ncbi:MAG TPA: hypothetical protein PK177_06225 [Burkholderiaceae bacterium]|nr:hypothetical protein [Burkholderiaceae bacterium]
MNGSLSSRATSAHRSKALAGALGLVLGWAGAHRLYLGWRFWWIYPVIAMPTMGLALATGGDAWFRHPGFLIAALVAVVAMLEAILICLTPDKKWDARHNPDSGIESNNRWAVVLIAIAALMLGTILLMSVLAIGLEGYVEATRTRTM